MGNAPYRYLNAVDAQAVLGAKKYERLKTRLEKGVGNRGVDFAFFKRMFETRFDSMPDELREALFRGFTSELTNRIDPENFLCTLAVVYSKDRLLLAKFLFRVYESDLRSGYMDRQRVEHLLYKAYGESCHAGDLKLLDSLFAKRKPEISQKEWEAWNGPLDVFLKWILDCLVIFMEQLPNRLLVLHRKYSALAEAEELMNKYHISHMIYEKLRHLFATQLAASQATELSLKGWKEWVCPHFLCELLAEVLFFARADQLKVCWRLPEFIDFCIIYGSSSLTQRAAAVYAAYLKYRCRFDVKVNSQRPCGESGVDDGWQALEELVLILSQPLDAFPPPATSFLGVRASYAGNHMSKIDLNALEQATEESTNRTGDNNSNNNSSSKKLRSYSLNLDAEGSMDLLRSNPTVHIQRDIVEAANNCENGVVTSNGQSLSLLEQFFRLNPVMNERLAEDLVHLKKEATKGVEDYLSFIVCHADLLPGLRDLSITACCLFNVEPPTPMHEKEYVTELTLRYLRRYPQTAASPDGPIGTEWCVVNKAWLDNWRLFVGQKYNVGEAGNIVSAPSKQPTTSNSNFLSNLLEAANVAPSSNAALIKSYRPTIIDNWSILKRSEARALLPGITLHRDIEIIPPPVFQALSAWYGGGPYIVRKVVSTSLLREEVLVSSNNPNSARDSLTHAGKAGQPRTGSNRNASGFFEPGELELFPLCVVLLTCDQTGRVSGVPREMLFSATITVQEALLEIADSRRIAASRIRLWNYAKPHWKDQFILTPELTLRQANLQDGQQILVEISLGDGSWPRSQLHAQLNNDEPVNNNNSTHSSLQGAAEESMGDDEDGFQDGSSHQPPEENHHQTSKPTTENASTAVSKRTVKHFFSSTATKRNDGLIGLDNLGNTCYLNSSLQALLHTDHLVEYFLSQAYMKDLNTVNKHGYKGRLALAFGKLVNELWSTGKKCITPRVCYTEIATARDQFAGNEQHDAHELLAFLLDGLSEDLNLVHTKPYTEQPDSDGRPDAELADIWWANHLKRDRSVVQALFTGQFKSVMTCQCGYSSARFEPFNFLAVPIPEDQFRVLHVVVMPQQLQKTVRCAVKVPKDGTVVHVIDKVMEYELEGLVGDADQQCFVLGEISQWRIRSFIGYSRRIDTLRDVDLITLFQVSLWETAEEKKTAAAADAEGSGSQALNSQNPAPPATSAEPNSQTPLRPKRFFVRDSSHVRIAFVQRHIRYVEGAALQTSGFDLFKIESFGLPILDVLPSQIKSSDLYHFLQVKLAPYLKANIETLLQAYDSSAAESGSEVDNAYVNDILQQLQRLTEATSTSHSRRTSATTARSQALQRVLSDIFQRQDAVANRLATVATASNDDIFAGPLNRRGFTLRLINGGSEAKLSCSKCNWLERCYGCVIPDHPDVLINLSDGESIAVDWHYMVFEELIDLQLSTYISNHVSVANERQNLNDAKIPLAKCLDKFTEQESLEGVVCPRCRSDAQMCRGFALWRLPPVLIIQLKRFQFDRLSRRKLNHKIDFPFADLDLTAYLASLQSLSTDALLLQHAMQSTKYDLYCVVHHIGALSGGHYVTTLRVKAKAGKSKRRGFAMRSTAVNDNSEHSNHSPGIASPQQEDSNGDRWFCLNDNLVSEVVDLNEIVSPSAYLLFYLRQDIQALDWQQLLQQLLHVPRDESPAPSADVDAATQESRVSSEPSGGAAGADARHDNPPPPPASVSVSAAADAPTTPGAARRIAVGNNKRKLPTTGKRNGADALREDENNCRLQ